MKPEINPGDAIIVHKDQKFNFSFENIVKFSKNIKNTEMLLTMMSTCTELECVYARITSSEFYDIMKLNVKDAVLLWR